MQLGAVLLGEAHGGRHVVLASIHEHAELGVSRSGGAWGHFSRIWSAAARQATFALSGLSCRNAWRKDADAMFCWPLGMQARAFLVQ